MQARRGEPATALGPEPEHDRSAQRTRRARGRSIIEVFGGGTRGWILYAVLVLPLVAILLVFDAIARLALPEDRPVWMFRRKRAAALYLLAAALAVLLVFALAGACGRARTGPARPDSAPPVPTAPPAQGAPAGQASGQPVAQAAGPPEPTAAPQPTPAPVVLVTPAPDREGGSRRIVRVANTGGAGVYLRRTPQLADRLRAWVDGTELEVLEEGPRIGDELWLKVRDPAGNIGYVPARYTAPAR